MDKLESMRTFIRVVETSSFSTTARELRMSQSTASKQVAALERELGAQLLRRSTRELSLTEAGEEFYRSARQVLLELEEAEARIGRGHQAPRGRLRVALSAGFGRLHIVPLLPAFLARHPELTVDTVVSDRHANLVEERIDLAVRLGPLADSSLIARPLASSPRITVASRACLRMHGTPRTPHDLASRPCISFLSNESPLPWAFNGPAGRTVLEPKGPLRTNDAEHIRAAVLAGLGFAQAPAWLFAGELKSGAVRSLLRNHPADPVPIHAVYAGDRQPPAKVRVLVDFLAAAFAKDPFVAGK